MDYSSRWLRIAVPLELAAPTSSGPWRLDRYVNLTAHNRCQGNLNPTACSANALMYSATLVTI